MLRSKFEQELNKLNVDLNKMCHLVITAIEDCVTAFKNQDKDLAREIINHDKIINDNERSIEARCLSLILKQQPIASDLRNVSTALKIVTDLERIGDQSADIAEILIELNGDCVYRMVEHIPNMAKMAIKMVTGSIEAFNDQDLNKANEVIQLDDKMDTYFAIVKQELNDIMKETVDKTDICINYLMIAKYFERIGDHAVNICQWVEFNKTGSVDDYRLL